MQEGTQQGVGQGSHSKLVGDAEWPLNVYGGQERDRCGGELERSRAAQEQHLHGCGHLLPCFTLAPNFIEALRRHSIEKFSCRFAGGAHCIRGAVLTPKLMIQLGSTVQGQRCMALILERQT